MPSREYVFINVLLLGLQKRCSGANETEAKDIWLQLISQFEQLSVRQREQQLNVHNLYYQYENLQADVLSATSDEEQAARAIQLDETYQRFLQALQVESNLYQSFSDLLTNLEKKIVQEEADFVNKMKECRAQHLDMPVAERALISFQQNNRNLLAITRVIQIVLREKIHGVNHVF